ncbi:MAG: hypothetical protein AB2697_08660 [Candidatus Thiodiazotropha endolucinida]
MNEKIEKLSEVERAKLLTLINEMRDRHNRLHGRLPTTGEEFRFYEEAVREINAQRQRNLAHAANAYKKGKYGLE